MHPPSSLSKHKELRGAPPRCNTIGPLRRVRVHQASTPLVPRSAQRSEVGEANTSPASSVDGGLGSRWARRPDKDSGQPEALAEVQSTSTRRRAIFSLESLEPVGGSCRRARGKLSPIGRGWCLDFGSRCLAHCSLSSFMGHVSRETLAGRSGFCSVGTVSPSARGGR